jgi:predicted aspartyl protease
MPFLILPTCLLAVSLPFASEAQASAKDQAIEVPFQFVQSEIILRVRVNDQGPFNMALDTGTDPSAIDLATARKIGLKLADKGQHAEGGGTGVNLGYETRLPIVAIDGLIARNVAAAAIDLSHISDLLGMPLHGVLGHSLLNRRIVQIDYPQRVVRFYSTSPYVGVDFQRNSAKYTRLSFRYDNDVLVDEVYVNGQKVTANFDTGGGGNSIFKFTPKAVASLGLEDKLQDAHNSSSAGYNGAYENREGKLDAVVSIGAINVQSPIVEFFPKGTGHDDKHWSVNIGNAFLKDYVVTIDYLAKVIVLERP